VSASGSLAFCQGNSVTLSANTGTGLSYQWLNNNSIISGADNATYNATASGNYTVIVTNTSGCSATSTAISVTVTGGPEVSLASFQAVCNTDAAFTLTGGSPAGGSYSGTSVSNNQFNPSVGPGTYSVTYTYSDAQNCQGTASANIVVNDCNTNSLNENQLSYLAFPNPFKDNLEIEFNGMHPAQVFLFDATGKMVLKSEVKASKISLKTSDLPNGIYTLKFSEMGLRRTVIKQ
jgi:hypothetical protein